MASGLRLRRARPVRLSYGLTGMSSPKASSWTSGVVVPAVAVARPADLLGTQLLLAQRLLALPSGPPPAAARCVLLDVGADDLEATGLVVPGVRVRDTRVDRVCVGAVVVPRGVRPPTRKSGRRRGVLSTRRPPRVGCATVWASSRAAVLAGAQPVPHTRGPGRERRGRVLCAAPSSYSSKSPA